MSILSAATWRRAAVVVASFRLRLFAMGEARALAANGGFVPRRRYPPSQKLAAPSNVLWPAPHFTLVTCAAPPAPLARHMPLMLLNASTIG